MIIKRHNTASVLIVRALKKRPCGANEIAYADIGSTDKLSEQGLDLNNTANKTLPSWLLPKLGLERPRRLWGAVCEKKRNTTEAARQC